MIESDSPNRPRRHAPRLSKTRFIHGWQCELRLWNGVHRPECATPYDDSQRAVFDMGHRVGDLARERYPGGVLVEADHRDIDGAVAATRELMDDPSVPAIFEAAIVHENSLTRVDILLRQGDAWDLIEVKSSTRADNKEHLHLDVAVQYWMLLGAGLRIRRAGLLLLNRDYVYPGGAYDLDQLFHYHDLTDYCRETLEWIGDRVTHFHGVMAQAMPPAVETGPHCSDPYDCPFWDHCSAGTVGLEDWINDLPHLKGWRREQLEAAGVETIAEIPEDFDLTPIQERVRRAVVTGQPHVMPGMKDVLETVEWPLYFLDFEAASLALPQHPGMRPWDQLPFQFSCHIQREPGGDLEHVEFLATNPSDPREALARELLETLGTTGSIVVYSGYECRTVRALAGWLPHLQDELTSLEPRLYDLLEVIRQNFVHPDFHGSFSIKSVLPALVPDMSYEGMDVADGTEAGRVWLEMIHADDSAQRKRWDAALRTYCRQDSLAMARLRERLLGYAQSHLDVGHESRAQSEEPSPRSSKFTWGPGDIKVTRRGGQDASKE